MGGLFSSTEDTGTTRPTNTYRENEPSYWSGYTNESNVSSRSSASGGLIFGSASRTRSGLTRMYGFFKCPSCRKTWESSHVYCITGTSEVEYGQECKFCHLMCKPYRIENIVCSRCGFEDCICLDKGSRHIDPDKHHRKDLCAKCRAGRPCV